MGQGWEQAAFRMHQYAATILPDMSEKAARRRVARLYETFKVPVLRALAALGVGFGVRAGDVWGGMSAVQPCLA